MRSRAATQGRTREDTQMTEPPRYTDSDSDSGKRTGEDSGTPRWVWVLGISVAIVALLFVAMMFLGGGEHGPVTHLARWR